MGTEAAARTVHTIEVTQDVIKPQTACVFDDDIEKVGDGRRRRMNLLTQTGCKGAIQPLIRFVGRHGDQEPRPISGKLVDGTP